jgi:replication factor A2
LVAQVISVSPQATNTNYSLDDGTGRIEARHWSDPSAAEDGMKEEEIQCVFLVFSILVWTFANMDIEAQ